MYAFHGITLCMHLTESHVFAFNRITRVCIQEDHTCMHLTGSHVYAFNRITHVCMYQNHTCMYVSESQVCI